MSKDWAEKVNIFSDLSKYAYFLSVEKGYMINKFRVNICQDKHSKQEKEIINFIHFYRHIS